MMNGLTHRVGKGIWLSVQRAAKRQTAERPPYEWLTLIQQKAQLQRKTTNCHQKRNAKFMRCEDQIHKKKTHGI